MYMKKIISGGILMLCGVILYLGAFIPAALYATKLGGWSTPPGRLGTALEATGGTTTIENATIIIISGIVLIIFGCFGEAILSFWKKVRKDNKT